MTSIDQESFAGGTGTYVVTFEKGLKVKPSEVAKAIAPFKLKGSGATVVRKIVKKDGSLMAGSLKLANRGKKGDRDFEDLLAEVAKLVKAGDDLLKVTGDLEEGEKGELTLKLSAIKVMPKDSK